MITPKLKIYKKISVLFLIFFGSVVFIPEAFAQVNYCTEPGAVPTFNKISLAGTAGGVNWIGTASDMNDGNLGSYMGFGDLIPAGGDDYSGEFEAIVTFASTVPEITKVQYNISGKTDGHTTDWIVKTYLYYSGAWQEIDSRKFGYTGEVEISGSWHNVEKVKVYIWAQITTACLKVEGCEFYRHLNELRAIGPQVYQDIVLRVFNGTEIVAIATEIGPATSPLRIAKNGVIYGIALVDPGDPNDSGVRIQTSAGIKALRKLFSYSP